MLPESPDKLREDFSFNLVMTKLPETSGTVLAIIFLVVNLSQLLRQFFWAFFVFLAFFANK
ncbi:hypothetical protein BFG60_4029 [Microcystis aeruginosa NIES-98]|jgi:hypothetical protein|nr:hypothetical protein BFG60_4029 [Microcystis aeruginosa NIES-98]